MVKRHRVILGWGPAGGGLPCGGFLALGLGSKAQSPLLGRSKVHPTPSGSEVVCAYRGSRISGWHGRGKKLVAPEETQPVGRPEGAHSQPAHRQQGWEASLGRRRLLKALGQPFSSEKQLQRQGEQRGPKAPVCNRSIPHLLSRSKHQMSHLWDRQVRAYG